ncbi:MAG: AraC family transcriptional regulator [Spirochaetales bacterium]|nr:AraC family transcriptional regulator [Spirochaetales bacterium]
MTRTSDRSISETLSHKSRARLIQSCPVGEDFTLAYWQNGRDRVSYAGADHHTLSVYKYGYTHALRRDINRRGKDGSFCLLPAGCPSQWQLEGPISFFHVYFDDRSIQRTAEKVYDRGGEGWTIPDITYRIDREFMLLCQWLLHSPPEGIRENSLLAEQNIHMLMTYLTGKIFRPSPLPPVKGGLSPRNSRLLADYIHENSAENLHLDELADLAGLSEFHFQRMFKQSFGLTPHDYLNRIRVEKSMELIKEGVPLAQVAGETGFSSQPHFTRVFKKVTGTTPGKYGRA